MSGEFRGIERLEEQKSKRSFVDANLQIQNQPSAETQKAEEAGDFKGIYEHFMGQKTEATSPYTAVQTSNEGDRLRVEMEEFKNQIDEFQKFRKEFETILQNISDLK